MGGTKAFVLGVAVALPAGFAAGVLTAMLLTAERMDDLRRAVAQKALRREPRVDFDTLHQ